MSPPPPAPDSLPDETPPLLQRLFDNMFLLLALGLVIMLIVYTGWGMWEIISMPQGTLP